MVFILNSLKGSREIKAASSSVNIKERIIYSVSEGGVPCGNLFKRSYKLLYDSLPIICDIIYISLVM